MKHNLILIGHVVGTFGIKGELKINSESDFIEYRFRVGAKIYFQDSKEYEVTSFRIHKGNVLITINNLLNINDVLDKVGMDVFASTNDVPPMKENEYYVDDLVGLQVLNTNNEILGTITDVIDIPSGYLLEITDKTNNNSFLVPFVDAFVKSIDDEKIIIEEIEGLRSWSLIF